jgi:hypothetical protein
VAECSSYGAGYAWGAVGQVDLKLAGSKASNFVAQILQPKNIDPQCGGGKAPFDLAFADGILGVGSSKSPNDTSITRRADFYRYVKNVLESNTAQGNGVAGVGVGIYACTTDKKQVCTVDANPPSLVQNLNANPIAALDKNNNGYVLSFPPLVDGKVWSGNFILGINTASNNQIPSSAKPIPTIAAGYLTAVYNGKPYPFSLWDSGSPVNTIPQPNPNGSTSETIAFYSPGLSKNGYSATLPVLLIDRANPMSLGSILALPALLAFNNVDPSTQKSTPKTVADFFNSQALYDLAGQASAQYFTKLNLSTPTAATDGGQNTIIMGLPMFMGRDLYFAISGQPVLFPKDAQNIQDFSPLLLPGQNPLKIVHGPFMAIVDQNGQTPDTTDANVFAWTSPFGITNVPPVPLNDLVANLQHAKDLKDLADAESAKVNLGFWQTLYDDIGQAAKKAGKTISDLAQQGYDQLLDWLNIA